MYQLSCHVACLFNWGVKLYFEALVSYCLYMTWRLIIGSWIFTGIVMTSLLIHDSRLRDCVNGMNALPSKSFDYKDDDDDAHFATSSSTRQKNRQEAIKRFKPGKHSVVKVVANKIVLLLHYWQILTV